MTRVFPAGSQHGEPPLGAAWRDAAVEDQHGLVRLEAGRSLLTGRCAASSSAASSPWTASKSAHLPAFEGRGAARSRHRAAFRRARRLGVHVWRPRGAGLARADVRRTRPRRCARRGFGPKMADDFHGSDEPALVAGRRRIDPCCCAGLPGSNMCRSEGIGSVKSASRTAFVLSESQCTRRTPSRRVAYFPDPRRRSDSRVDHRRRGIYGSFGDGARATRRRGRAARTLRTDRTSPWRPPCARS